MPKGIPKNGINKGWFKRNRTIKNCLVCNNEFEVTPCQTKQGHGIYCSKQCHGKAKLGENHHRFVKRIKRECGGCGKVFVTTENENGKFCDRKCRGKYLSKTQILENHPNWQGGISFEPYPVDWTRTLRRAIRERDFYTCQICKEPQGDRALSVHHIDYNKKNCNSDNLISLCIGCHNKTNFNRSKWQEYFNQFKSQICRF